MVNLFRFCFLSICLLTMSTMSMASTETGSELFLKAKNYHDGIGVAQDFSKAHETYMKAVSLGSTDAMLNLGFMYFVGEGVEVDYGKARRWYELAAAQGHKDALANLAMMDSRQLGLPATKAVPSVKENPSSIATSKSTIVNTEEKSTQELSTSKKESAESKTPKARLETNKKKKNKKDKKPTKRTETVKTASLNTVTSNRIIMPKSKSTHEAPKKTKPASETNITSQTPAVDNQATENEVQAGGIVVENFRARFNTEKSSITISGNVKNVTGEPKEFPTVTLSILDAEGLVLENFPLEAKATQLMPYEAIAVRQVVGNLPKSAARLKFEIAKEPALWELLGTILIALFLVGVILAGANWMTKRKSTTAPLFII